jgi:putative endonuclease
MVADGEPGPVKAGSWQVYMILCSDATLYTGITKDVERRFAEHASGKGARYFRGREPRRVVFLECGHSQSSAGSREIAIKQLPRSAKLRLINSPQNQMLRLEQSPG